MIRLAFIANARGNHERVQQIAAEWKTPGESQYDTMRDGPRT
jgi:hypothetical protein